MTNSNGQGGSALPLDDRKRAARAHAHAVLSLHAEPARGRAVGCIIRAHVALPPGSVVGSYLGLPHELDMRDLMAAWQSEGHVIALPRTPARGQPLTFHRWGYGDNLVRERFQTLTSDGPEVQPTVLLVPLLAFDRRGYRLGHGGGYYDRTLAARPGIPTVGCAYAAVEVSAVPVGPYDRPLDAIATETEFITIKAPPCASSS